MTQFLFTCPQGKFTIPNGESRIGSDSTCPVCVQGEGILPVHAYLKVDGETLLIRPSSDKAPVSVDGKPVTGPQTVKVGQLLGLGALTLRVENGSSAESPMSQRAWYRRALKIGVGVGGALALLAVLAVVLRYAWFNESFWREHLQAQLESGLLREDAEVGEVSVSYLQGEVEIRKIAVPNKEAFSDEKYLLRVERIHLSLEPWALLRSLGGEIRAAKVTIEHPEILLERTSRNGKPVSNIEDILKHFLSGPSSEGPLQLPLTALDAEVNLTGGLVRVRDGYTELGESSLQDLALSLTLPGFDSDLAYTLSAKTVASGGKSPGSIGLKGEMKLFSGPGLLDTEKVGPGKVAIDLQEFDLARLFSHLEWSFPVNVEGVALQVVPGKPVTGTFQVEFSSMKHFTLSGQARSESLVSVLEKGRAPLGQVPSLLDLKLEFDAERGPVEVVTNLVSVPQGQQAGGEGALKIVKLHMEGKQDPAGGYRYFVELDTLLQELCATDVGERLGLKGRLKGRLKGSANLVRRLEANGQLGQLEIDANLEQDGEVLVDPALNVWQAAKLSAGLLATAKPNERGEIAELQANFNAKAPSFEARSLEPHVTVKSLDNPSELSINAHSGLKLNGREFWREFSPLLKLFNLDQPIEEIFDLKVLATSELADAGEGLARRKISLGARGTMRRQWKEDPKPQEVVCLVEHFPEVFAAYASAAAPKGEGTPPYLKLRLRAEGQGTPEQEAAGHKPNVVDLKNVAIYQDGPRLRLDVPAFEVEANLEDLRERFQPYIERLAAWLGSDFHKTYAFTGDLKQTGSLNIVRDTRTAERPTPRIGVNFDLGLKGRALKLSGPRPGGAAGEIFAWSEPEFEFHLKGAYEEQAAASKEELGLRRLEIERFAFDKGRLGAFALEARGVDLALLQFLSGGKALAGRTWTDGLEAFKFQGTVAPGAFEFLRTLKVIPPAPAYAGKLELNVDFARREDRIKLEKLVFQDATPEGEGAWLKDVNLTGELRQIRGLFGTGENGQVLPFHHLGQHLVLRSLHVDMPAMVRWIEKQPEQASAWHVPEGLAALVRSKQLVPKGEWSVENLALLPSQNKERSWNLVGAFRHDLRMALPPLSGAKPAELIFEGPWRIDEARAAGITFSEDFKSFSVDVGVNFDDADVGLNGFFPEYDFAKAPQKPLRLSLEGLSRSAGGPGTPTLMQLTALKVEGGPAPIEAADVHVKTIGGADGEELLELRAGEVTVLGGPWPGSIQKLFYDAKGEAVAGTLLAPSLDLTRLAALIPPSPLQQKLAFSGTIESAVVEVSSTLERLQWLTLTPGRDKLSIRGNLKDVTLTGRPAANEQLDLFLNGECLLDLQRLSTPALTVAIRHAAPSKPGEAPKAAIHRLTLSGFEVTPAAAGGNLPEALLQAQNLLGDQVGVLRIKLPVVFETPVKVDDLLAVAETAKRLFVAPGETPVPPPVAEAPLGSALAPFVIEGSLKAPSLDTGGDVLENLEIPAFTIKDQVFVPALLTAGLAGAKLTVKEGRYDLTGTRIKHTQRIELVDADLGRLLGTDGKLEAAKGYLVRGKVSVAGQVSGTDVSPQPDWMGGLEVSLADLVAEQPGAASAPKSSGGFLGIFKDKLLGPAVQQFAGLKELPFAELSKALPFASEGQSWLNYGMFGMQMYLGGLGFDMTRLEFEPTRIVIQIDKGVADVRQSKLVGKGPSAGLALAFKGRLRLYDRNFDDRFEVWPTGLPQGALDNLHVDRWPADVKARFLAELADGGFVMTLTGNANSPSIKYPQDKIVRYIGQAFLNKDRVTTEAELQDGLQFAKRTWGATDQGQVALGELLNRVGFPLPGTQAAQKQGGDFFSSMMGSRSTSNLLAPLTGSKGLSTQEALDKLMAPPGTTPPPRPKPPEEALPPPPPPQERPPVPPKDPVPPKEPEPQPRRQPKEPAPPPPPPQEPAPTPKREPVASKTEASKSSDTPKASKTEAAPPPPETPANPAEEPEPDVGPYQDEFKKLDEMRARTLKE